MDLVSQDAMKLAQYIQAIFDFTAHLWAHPFSKMFVLGMVAFLIIIFGVKTWMAFVALCKLGKGTITQRFEGRRQVKARELEYKGNIVQDFCYTVGEAVEKGVLTRAEERKLYVEMLPVFPMLRHAIQEMDKEDAPPPAPVSKTFLDKFKSKLGSTELPQSRFMQKFRSSKAATA